MDAKDLNSPSHVTPSFSYFSAVTMPHFDNLSFSSTFPCRTFRAVRCRIVCSGSAFTWSQDTQAEQSIPKVEEPQKLPFVAKKSHTQNNVELVSLTGVPLAPADVLLPESSRVLIASDAASSPIYPETQHVPQTSPVFSVKKTVTHENVELLVLSGIPASPTDVELPTTSNSLLSELSPVTVPNGGFTNASRPDISLNEKSSQLTTQTCFTNDTKSELCQTPYSDNDPQDCKTLFISKFKRLHRVLQFFSL